MPYEKVIADHSVAGSGRGQVGDGGIQTTPSALVRRADN
jgi:hypothetical protein